ncbi:MAG: hypothetical protein V3U54_08890 [Thermodesulfobacteriota bacterium]
MTKIYLAHAMTGRKWEDVQEESKESTRILNSYGIDVFDPIYIEEVITGAKDKIGNEADDNGLRSWRGDKKAIRDVHVMLDITPEMRSEGVLRELGYSRFLLWKPTVRVYKPGSKPHMITIFEDDVVAYSLEQAALIINERWGTWFKRFVWRIKMLARCLPKFIWHQIKEFK